MESDIPELIPVCLSDKVWIDPLVAAENSPSADFNFGNIYLWDPVYKQSLIRLNGRFSVMPGNSNTPFFVYPVGYGDLADAVKTLHALAGKMGFVFTLRGVTSQQVRELEALFPGKFDFTDDRDFYDYIYSAEKLASLSGKKLHGKRNHINRFVTEYSWSFEPLTPDMAPMCMDLLRRWTEENTVPDELGVPQEHLAIVRAFENFDILGLDGGVLFANGAPAAFTIGEKISSDTYDVHFEKAFHNIDGAYTMINREFVRMIMDKYPGIVYINREDDIGMPNLRQAKQSYYPEFLVEKHTAVWRDDR